MSRRLPRLQALYVEWKARRAGRRGLQSSIHRATRDVTGPTGWMFSAGWDKLDEHRDAYMRSFDRRVPPSLFVADRDHRRHGQPMPLVERCIEDHPQSRIGRAQATTAIEPTMAASSEQRAANDSAPADAQTSYPN